MSPRNFSERDADFDVAEWQLSKPEPQWRDGREFCQESSAANLSLQKLQCFTGGL